MSIQNFLIKRQLKKSVSALREKTKDRPVNMDTARRYMDQVFTRFKVPNELTISSEEIEGVPVEWINGPKNRHDALLLYYHGGGYCMGSIKCYRSMVGKMCLEMGMPGLTVEYRLAPENPFPAATDDALTVYKNLLDSGHDPKKIIIAGDSAGGGLTLSTLINLRALGLPQPAGAILISPWLDLTGTSESTKTKVAKDWILETRRLPEFGQHYAGELALDDPRVSPLFADLSDLAPILIQVGTDEILLDDSKRLAEKLRSAGRPYELQVEKGQLHVWHVMWPILPEARKAIKKMAVFSDGLL
ncbi:MAG: alpha/beta hydrolase [Bacteroidota bacterium]